MKEQFEGNIKKLKTLRSELSKLEKRNNELMILFKKLYEDFSLERISEEKFKSLSDGYLSEQKMLKEKIPLKQGELLTAEKITKRSDTFITKVN